MSITCASCNTQLPDVAKFCFNCGQAVPERQRRQMRIFAIANQKGRVGKTTTAINLAACLAETGRKILVVDLSPSADATTGFGVDSHKIDLSIYDLLVNDAVTAAQVIKSEIRPNLSLLPATVDLWAAVGWRVSWATRSILTSRSQIQFMAPSN